MDKKVSLNVKFEEVQDFQHPQFTKVKVWVATYGENANKSNITKEAFEKAMPSLLNVPILGEYSESIEDFKGHGGKIEITDEGINFIETTKPYGVIPESCNPRWEEDDNGIEYLVCDGLIWTGRYEEALKVMENKNNQSMEINVLDYKIDNDIVVINDFTFTGICILGEAVQPCFPSAKIVYSLNKDEYKEEFNLMLNEIKNIDFSKGGENPMNEKEQIISKFSHLKGEDYDKIISDETLSVEDLEKALFSLSVNDLERRVREELKNHTITIKDWWDDEYETQKYYLEDVLHEENILICEDCQSWYKFYGIPYSIDGDSIVIDYENAKRYTRGDWRIYIEGDKEVISNVFEAEVKHNKDKALEIKSEFDATNEQLIKVKAEFTDVQSDLESVRGELEPLKQFKADIEQKEFELKETERKNSIDETIAKYSELANVEGFDKVIENKYNMSIDEIEVKCKVFAFDNSIVIGKKQPKKNFSKENNKIPVLNPNKELIENEIYGGILDKFIKKNN